MSHTAASASSTPPTPASPPSVADPNPSGPPTWDLCDLFDGPDDPQLQAVLDEIVPTAREFADRWRGRIATTSATNLATAIAEYEALVVPMRQAATFAALWAATGHNDPQRQALVSRIGTLTAEAQQRTVFLELELLGMDDDWVAGLLADPVLAPYVHYLQRMRRRRPHVLDEEQERLISVLAPTGPAAWQQLFTSLLGNVAVQSPSGPVPLDAATTALRHPDRAARNGAAEAISRALLPTLDVRAAAFDTLLLDKAIRDDLRGYPTWLTDRNLSNEVTDLQVTTLLDAVSDRYDLVVRWYRLKARLLGLQGLAEHDRYAPLAMGTAPETYSWAAARDLVLDAYADLSPRVADIARLYVDNQWIDAVPGPHKQPGAFCTAVPERHPYIAMSFNGTDGDVMTLAHELGHGIHGWLHREVGAASFDVPLTMAETASVFGEAVTYRRLAQASPDDATTLRMLAHRIDSEIATIFRQVAMCRFEDSVHTARRERGALSVPDLNDAWMTTQQAMFGDALTLGDRYAHWWSSVPHFVTQPGYVYAYAFGNLLAFALMDQFAGGGDDFIDAYLGMLSRAGGAPPEDLLAPLGVDLADPDFWHRGLTVIEDLIVHAEDLADRINPPTTGHPGGPVQHRPA